MTRQKEAEKTGKTKQGGSERMEKEESKEKEKRKEGRERGRKDRE